MQAIFVKQRSKCCENTALILYFLYCYIYKPNKIMFHVIYWYSCLSHSRLHTVVRPLIFKVSRMLFTDLFTGSVRLAFWARTQPCWKRYWHTYRVSTLTFWARYTGFDFKSKTTYHKNPQLTTTYRQKAPIAQYVRRIDAQIAVPVPFCAICWIVQLIEWSFKQSSIIINDCSNTTYCHRS